MYPLLLPNFLLYQDFQYKATRVEADVLYDASKDHIPEKATLYIATDERKKDFFNLFKKHYNVYFLDDFKDLVSTHQFESLKCICCFERF